MEFTLGKSERLGRREFRRTKWKRRGSTPHFLLFKSRNEDSGKRFGVVIQRKTIKGAVVRNRIRRSVREFFRLNKHLFEDCHDHYVRIVRMPGSFRWDAVSTELRALVAGTVKQ
jgi:ribonuclease P protein component